MFDGPKEWKGSDVALTVRYRLNGDDGLECLRVHQPSFQTNVIISIVASGAIIAIGLIWLVLPGNHALAWLSIGIGLAILVLGIVQRAYMVRRLRHTWNQTESMELTVRDGGFTANAEGAVSEVVWSRFVRLHEGPKHFLLYRSPDQYAIVPKRGFDGQAEVDAFRDIATRGIARKAVEQPDEADGA